MVPMLFKVISYSFGLEVWYLAICHSPKIFLEHEVNPNVSTKSDKVKMFFIIYFFVTRQNYG